MRRIRRTATLVIAAAALVATSLVAIPAADAQTATIPSVGAGFDTAGPYAVTVEATADHTLFSPSDLGAGGVRHPVLLWGNGTGASPAAYGALLRHWASHGFIVVAANTTNAGTGAEMLGGLDLLAQRHGTTGDRFHQRVDLARVGTTGHSQGGFGALRAAADPRVSTSMPLQGAARFSGLTAIGGSVLFLSGGQDGIVTPALVRGGFTGATHIPAAYAELRAAGHFEPVGTGGGYRGVTTAWARWMLMDDPIAEQWFVGDGCVLCASPAWVYESNPLLRPRVSTSPPPPGGDVLSQLPWTAGERQAVGTIHRLYVALLGRVADSGGLAYWSGLHQRGESMTSIARQIANSPEFAANFGTPDDGAFVALLYRHVFDRQPDAGGLAYWLGILADGRASRAHMIVLFVDSDEMIARVRAARA
jgi:hypothetical protein